MKRSGRGPLLDMIKLNDLSSNIMGVMNKDDFTENVISWAEDNDKRLLDLISKDVEYFKKVINIERETDSPRKDIVTYSDTFDSVSYFYDEYFVFNKEEFDDFKLRVLENILLDFDNDDLYKESSIEKVSEWVTKIKEIYNKLIINSNFESLKFADFMMIIRKSVTGRERTPNMYYVMNVLGKDKVLNRIKNIIK